MKRHKHIWILGCTVVFSLPLQVFAQSSAEVINKGNEKYHQQDYKGAQELYEQAPEQVEGAFNLGNALFSQQKYEEAAAQYAKVVEQSTDPSVRSNAYHNMGNALLEQKKYEESINAYKKALRDNPNNTDTKYNLAYAQQMLKKQQQQQQQKNDQKKDQQQKPQQQNKQQQDPKKDDQQKQDQLQDPKEMSKDELDRVLKSLNEDDKAVQDKVNKQKAKPAGGDPEKDW